MDLLAFRKGGRGTKRSDVQGGVWWEGMVLKCYTKEAVVMEKNLTPDAILLPAGAKT